MNQELSLVASLIEMAESQEAELKKLRLASHQANKTLGEGALLFHLRRLEELLKARPECLCYQFHQPPPNLP